MLVWQAVFAQLDGQDAEAVTAQAVAVAERMRIPDARRLFEEEVAFRVRSARAVELVGDRAHVRLEAGEQLADAG